jgi:hypothetical protein
MLARDEPRASSVDAEQKGEGAEVAVVDQQIARLKQRQHLIQQRPLLGVAVFAKDNVLDEHALRVQQYQGLTRQSTRGRAAQNLEAMFAAAEVIAVEDPRTVARQQRRTTAARVLDQLAHFARRVPHQGAGGWQFDVVEFVVKGFRRYGNTVAQSQRGGMNRRRDPAHHQAGYIDQRGEQQFAFVLGHGCRLKDRIQLGRGKKVLHHGPLHHTKRTRLHEPFKNISKHHVGHPP